MKIGWNLGNTLEAIGGETAWGNPKVTDTLIKEIKKIPSELHMQYRIDKFSKMGFWDEINTIKNGN